MASIREAISEELHKSARRNYARRPVILKSIGELYQIDLVEMNEYSRMNKGYKYIMTIIDCFSKFAHAIPLKNKTADAVVRALSPILKSNKIIHIQTDQGKEFFNSKVKQLFKKYKINHYSTFSEKKASIVERFNRTLKNLMWKKFTTQGNYRWVGILKNLVAQYNNSHHRTIKMRPIDVNKHNERSVLLNIKKTLDKQHKLDKQKPKFKVGDKVRINKYKGKFDKGYLPNWSNEIFTILAVKLTQPITYILKDEMGEIIKGDFTPKNSVKQNLIRYF